MVDNIVDWKPLSENTVQAIMRMNEHSIGIDSGHGSLVSMAPMCFNLGKKVGDTVHMLARPTGGTAPYIVSFKKGTGTVTTLLKQITNLSEGQMVTYDYILADVDANLTQTFSSLIEDSCPSGAKSSVESCDVTVSAVAPIVCGTPACNLVVT